MRIKIPGTNLVLRVTKRELAIAGGMGVLAGLGLTGLSTAYSLFSGYSHYGVNVSNILGNAYHAAWYYLPRTTLGSLGLHFVNRVRKAGCEQATGTYKAVCDNVSHFLDEDSDSEVEAKPTNNETNSPAQEVTQTKEAQKTISLSALLGDLFPENDDEDGEYAYTEEGVSNADFIMGDNAFYPFDDKQEARLNKNGTFNKGDLNSLLWGQPDANQAPNNRVAVENIPQKTTRSGARF